MPPFSLPEAAINAALRKAEDSFSLNGRFPLRRQRLVKAGATLLKPYRLAGFIEKAMGAGSRAHQRAAHPHLVAEPHLHRPQFQDADGNFDYIRKGGTPALIAGDADNRGNQALLLHSVIAPAQLFEEIHPRFLHKAQIVGMVRELHAVGFVVLYAMLIGFHGVLLCILSPGGCGPRSANRWADIIA